jgi:hypothetical protein
MSTRCSVAVLLLALSLAALAEPPQGAPGGVSPRELAGPKPRTYEDQVRAYLQEKVMNPQSVRDLTISKPVRASCGMGLQGQYYGWRVSAKYHVPHIFGTTVNYVAYHFWFRGEELKGVSEEADHCPTLAPAPPPAATDWGP